MRARLLAIAAIDIGLLIVGFALREQDVYKDAALSLAVAAIGIVTLLGLLAARDENTQVTTRFALTVSVSAVWFASVGTLLFFVGEKAPLASEAFNGISIVMGVVVAFYFGAQAYEAVGKAKASADGGGASTPVRDSGVTTRGGSGTSRGDEHAPAPLEPPDRTVEIYD
jgi:arginine exporter protein ArgO